MGTHVNRLPMPDAQWLDDRHIPFTVAGAALDFNQLPDYPLVRGTLGQCIFYMKNDKPNQQYAANIILALFNIALYSMT